MSNGGRSEHSFDPQADVDRGSAGRVNGAVRAHTRGRVARSTSSFAPRCNQKNVDQRDDQPAHRGLTRSPRACRISGGGRSSAQPRQEQQAKADKTRRAPQLVHHLREIEGDHRRGKDRRPQVDAFAAAIVHTPGDETDRAERPHHRGRPLRTDPRAEQHQQPRHRASIGQASTRRSANATRIGSASARVQPESDAPLEWRSSRTAMPPMRGSRRLTVPPVATRSRRATSGRA